MSCTIEPHRNGHCMLDLCRHCSESPNYHSLYLPNIVILLGEVNLSIRETIVECIIIIASPQVFYIIMSRDSIIYH